MANEETSYTIGLVSLGMQKDKEALQCLIKVVKERLEETKPDASREAWVTNIFLQGELHGLELFQKTLESNINVAQCAEAAVREMNIVMARNNKN